jgi:hypothetical protein
VISNQSTRRFPGHDITTKEYKSYTACSIVDKNAILFNGSKTLSTVPCSNLDRLQEFHPPDHKQLLPEPELLLQ